MISTIPSIQHSVLRKDGNQLTNVWLKQGPAGKIPEAPINPSVTAL
jgi:hypothetical protein